ncbi:MAG: hypothetical protein Q7T49_01125 [bacterium]|nr:hypothetical protein [bacterium]
MTKKFIDTIKIITLVAVLTIGGTYAYAIWQGPPAGTPPTCPPGYQGCDVPINEGAVAQIKQAGLGLWGRFYTKDKASIGSGDGPITIADVLKLKVFGKVGAEAYCDQDGNNCIIPPGGGGGGFWQLVTGTQMIQNTNTGKVEVTGRIKIAGGRPEKGKVLAAIDNTGLARWRYLAELPGQSTLVVSCGAGKAIQDIKPDGTPTCVNLQNQSTSNGNGFIFALLTGAMLNNLLNSNDSNDAPTSSGGGGCQLAPAFGTCANGWQPTCVTPAVPTSLNNFATCQTRMCC